MSGILETWELYLAPLRPWLDQSTVVLGRVPAIVGFAVLVLPLVLAAVSRRLLIILAALLLVAMAALLLARPVPGLETVALGLYLGSFIVALAGIAARRSATAVQVTLDGLRSEMNQLRAAQSRQLIMDLNKPRATPAETRDVPRQSSGEKLPGVSPK